MSKRRWSMVGGGVAIGVGALVVLGLLSVGGLVLGGVLPVPSTSAAPAGCGAGTAELTLHGAGTASGRPDLLTVSLQVEETASTAQQAMADDDARTAAVDAVLQRTGVLTSDVQTADLTLSPQYHYPSGGPPELVGYSVDQTLTAQIHDLASAGTVLDDAVAAGGSATSIASVTFSDQDPTALQDEARAAAVKNAVTHARVMANAAGNRLVRLCSVTDDTASSEPAPQYAFNGQVAAPAAEVPTVPLSAGTLSAHAQVTLVYALAPRR